MSSQKKIARYPLEFEDLITRAVSKPQILTFPTAAKAVAMRRELYNYRFALRKAAKRNPEVALHIVLWRANRLTFRLDDNRLTVGELHQLNETLHYEQSELNLWPRRNLSDPT